MKAFFKGLIQAFSMFTAIPMPQVKWDDESSGWMLPHLPAVGLAIGGLWYGVGKLLAYFRPPLLVSGALLCLFPSLITGFFHLDGYMDTNDALLSRRDLEEKRRILKDPHTGAFGVIALCCLLLFQFSAATEWMQSGRTPFSLLFIPVFSRLMTGLFMLHKKPLPQSSLGAYLQKNRKPRHTVLLVVYLALAICGILLTMGVRAWKIFLPQAAVFVLALLYADRQMQGINGDICGYALTLSECAALVAAVL